ncbi:MAG: hypothetical protein K1X57_22665 [Gemmataceae bacterium]|nr:hypothetical protein [Gemmataceae bacterium]
MPASIQIVRGPNAGWTFRVTGEEVRIGRGAGHAIRVEDPAWAQGHLRVQHRAGGYVVTNHLPHPIYLDGKLLAVEQQRTWYAGSLLQPTAATLLRLDVIEGESESKDVGTGPVVAAAPPSQSSMSVTNVVLTLALVAGAGFAWFASLPGASVDRAEQIHRLVRQLAEGELSHEQAVVRKSLREALLAESQRAPASAYVLYKRACDQLGRVRSAGGSENSEVWEQLDRVVHSHLASLAASLRLTRGS